MDHATTRLVILVLAGLSAITLVGIIVLLAIGTSDGAVAVLTGLAGMTIGGLTGLLVPSRTDAVAPDLAPDLAPDATPDDVPH